MCHPQALACSGCRATHSTFSSRGYASTPRLSAARICSFVFLRVRSLPLRDGLKSYYYALTAHWGSWQLDESNKRYWLLSPDLRYALLSAIEGSSNITNAASSITPRLSPRLALSQISPNASLMLVSQVSSTLHSSNASTALYAAAWPPSLVALPHSFNPPIISFNFYNSIAATIISVAHMSLLHLPQINNPFRPCVNPRQLFPLV